MLVETWQDLKQACRGSREAASGVFVVTFLPRTRKKKESIVITRILIFLISNSMSI